MNSLLRTIMESVVIAALFALTLVSMSYAQPASSGDRDGGWHVDPFSEVVDHAPMSEVKVGLNAFNWRLYRQISADPGENIFYSPYSIYEALAMTYTGAGGATAQEMRSVLTVDLDAGKLGESVKEFRDALHSRTQGNQKFQLTVANALWGQKTMPFDKTFVSTLEAYYGAGLQLVDYKANPDKARAAINAWVEKQTNQKIQDLLGDGAVTEDTRLVLTNAIYFKAAWATPFQKGLTTKKDFRLHGGKTVSVDMMRSVETYRLYQGDGFKVAVLPYQGNQMSMAIILPDQGKMEATERLLAGGDFGTMIPAMALLGEFRKLDLQMPRFRIETQFSLAATLKAMGMPTAFSTSADFSGMAQGQALRIDDVIHKAFVSVDENGTEAAAATGVAMNATSAHKPVEPLPFICDRPFLFVVQDNELATALFAGRVSNPS